MSRKRSPFDDFFDMADEVVDGIGTLLDPDSKEKSDVETPEKRSDGVPDTQRKRSDDDTPPLRNPHAPVRPKAPRIIDID